MKFIELTKGQKTIVDDEDYEELSKYKWYFASGGYAGRGCPRRILMHRVIMGEPEGLLVDHINRNTLDNRRRNLRVATKATNNQNQCKPKNNTSGYKGVYFRKNKKRWVAQISVNYKKLHLGYFSTPELASEAYESASKKHHAKYSYHN